MVTHMDDKTSATLSYDERNTSSLSLFIIWVAATSSISSIPIAAIMIQTFPNVPLIYIYGFNLLSYVMLGLLSIPGFRFGIPMMKFSESLFGRFNDFIAFATWLTQIGWQIVILIMITYIINGALFKSSGIDWLLISLFLSTLLTYLAPIMGIKFIKMVQYLSSVMLITGALYVILTYQNSIAGLMPRAGSNVNYISLIASFSLIMTDSVLSWTMFASDYSRYVSNTESKSKVLFSAFLGGGLGSFIALCAGSILVINHFITFSMDSINLNSHVLPKLFYLLFVILSILGLASANSLNVYSSSLNMGVIFKAKKSRSNFAIINLAVVEVIAITIILYLNNFLTDLQDFLSFAIFVSAPWTGYMILEVVKNKLYRISDELINSSRTLDAYLIAISILFTSTYYFIVKDYYMNNHHILIYFTAIIGCLIGVLLNLFNIKVNSFDINIVNYIKDFVK